MWGFMLDHRGMLKSAMLKQRVKVANFSLYCTPNAGFKEAMYYNRSEVEARFHVECIRENSVIETRPFAILVGIREEEAEGTKKLFVRDVNMFIVGDDARRAEFHQFLNKYGSYVWRKFKAFGLAQLEMMNAETPDDDLADPAGVAVWMWGFMLDHRGMLKSAMLKQRVKVANFSLYCTPNAGFKEAMYYNRSEVEARFYVECIRENSVIETRPFAILVGIREEEAGGAKKFFVRDVNMFIVGDNARRAEFHQFLNKYGSYVWQKFKAFGLAQLEMMNAETPDDDLADPAGVAGGSAAEGSAAGGDAV